MDIKKIRDKLDIVDYIGRYVDFQTRNGVEFFCSCPFHRDDNPSFFVNREKQLWNCYSCNSSGDILSFIQKYHNVPFREAVQILEMETGAEIIETPCFIKIADVFRPKERAFEQRLFLLPNAMDAFPPSHEIKEWLDEGITRDVLERYNVRYNADKTRIMFPIYDEEGRLATIKYRNLVTKPKYSYINKLGKKDFLFNFGNARDTIVALNECIVVESEKSVLKLESWGVHNSVAAGSHGLKDEIQLLIKCPFNTLVFAYDEDVTVDEIYKQSEILKHYKSVFRIPMRGVPPKCAPVDMGYERWLDLYAKRRKVE